MPRADDGSGPARGADLLTLSPAGPAFGHRTRCGAGAHSNAIRAHLATLERDGLVRTSGMRRGARKPAATYDLSPKAEQLFPKAAWRPCFGHLLAALRESLTSRQAGAVVQRAGHRMSRRTMFPPGTSARRRPPAEAATRSHRTRRILRSGAENGTAASLGCVRLPIGHRRADGHPELCRLAETVLADVAWCSRTSALPHRAAAMPVRDRREPATSV